MSAATGPAEISDIRGHGDPSKTHPTVKASAVL
jgi:hypothetical protein